MNAAKGSIRTLLKWKRCTVENGVSICLVTLAGVLHIRQTSAGEYKRQEKMK
jgi:hypothetical protein